MNIVTGANYERETSVESQKSESEMTRAASLGKLKTFFHEFQNFLRNTVLAQA